MLFRSNRVYSARYFMVSKCFQCSRNATCILTLRPFPHQPISTVSESPTWSSKLQVPSHNSSATCSAPKLTWPCVKRRHPTVTCRVSKQGWSQLGDNAHMSKKIPKNRREDSKGLFPLLLATRSVCPLMPFWPESPHVAVQLQPRDHQKRCTPNSFQSRWCRSRHQKRGRDQRSAGRS